MKQQVEEGDPVRGYAQNEEVPADIKPVTIMKYRDTLKRRVVPITFLEIKANGITSKRSIVQTYIITEMHADNSNTTNSCNHARLRLI